MPRARRTPPLPPMFEHLPEVDRRLFLRGLGAAGLGIGGSSLLAACGTSGTKISAQDECKSTDKSASEKKLVWSNWPEYIDVDGNRIPSLEKFQKQSGIKVTYNTDVNDNNDFYAKVKNQLGACEPVGRDLFVLTDWMAEKMVNAGWLQKLDHANMPNVQANLVDNLKHPQWDKNRDYSVPWQSGFTGIAYNAKYTKPVGSFEELMTRSDLKGKISLLKEMRDTMSFMLKLSSADPTDFDDNEWSNAIDKLKGYVASGQIRRFTGNDYVDDLNKGDIVACEAWSGDVIAMQFDNPDIKWVVPEEGLVLWSDNMLVPNKADHKANAEKLMNFYYDPANAAMVSAWVNYICPVNGAQEAMTKVDKTLVHEPLIFPTPDFLSNAFSFKATDDKTAEKYDRDFQTAISA
jgi:spermidine/putrescine transport system substrate-binding protein